MLSRRRAATLAGALLLTAMVASILGGSLIDSVVSTEADLTTVHTREAGIVLGVLLELVDCAAVVGIAVVLFPVLRRHSQVSASGYVAFRSIEAALLAVAAVIPLAILGLSRDLAADQSAGASSLDSLGPALLAMREQIYGLGVVTFFCLGAALLYSVLYRSRLVPPFIAVWGLVGVATVFLLNLLEALGGGVSGTMLLALPIITNEIFLGVWLIAKGFDRTAVGVEPA
jgi:hypothetical protein